MPKRRPNASAEPLDIFSNPRLGAAMAAATSTETAAPAALEPASPPAPAWLRVPTPGAERAPASGASEAAAAAHPAPRFHEERPAAALVSAPAPAPASPAAAPRLATAPRKGRAAAVEEPAIEAPIDPNVALKFRVPQTLRSEFQTFKAELSAVLGGVALDDSNLGRPLLEHFLVEQRERILEAAGSFRGRLRRPANGDTVGMAEFDHALGEIFSEARKRRRAPSAGGEAS